MGVVATLNYTVDTTVTLDNGPLYVIPGTHTKVATTLCFQFQLICASVHPCAQGHIPHIDTSSHLALPPDEWKFENAIPIDGRS